MSSSDFWKKMERGLNKLNDWTQNEYEKKEREMQRKLASKTNDEIIRISKNPQLSEFQRELVDNEMRKRGL